MQKFVFNTRTIGKRRKGKTGGRHESSRNRRLAKERTSEDTVESDSITVYIRFKILA